MDSVYAQVILGSMVGAMMPCLPDSGGMVSDESGAQVGHKYCTAGQVLSQVNSVIKQSIG